MSRQFANGVAKALFNKGSKLGKLGRMEEKIATYDDLSTRFGTTPEPVLREWIKSAHEHGS